MTKTFGPTSTTDEVLDGVDLIGRRILVTGVSAGLGVETARSLMSKGANVVGVVRDLDKAKRATKDIKAAAGNRGTLEFIELDLASLASVRAGADKLVKDGKPLDAIIANAGVMACPQGKTADGYEMQFGTNHLGHFMLVNRLVPLLKSPSRVINLSSSGHRFADVDLDDPNFERTTYHPFVAYGRSKTANILFSEALDRRLKRRNIRAAAVHPGGIQTELGRHMTPEMIAQIIPQGGSQPAFVWKSIPQGAATSVWSAVVAPAEQVGGRYCEDCHVAELTNDPNVRRGVRAYALDPKRADALWAKSEEMVREKFSYA